MAAALACGSASALSFVSAAALFRIADWERTIEISVSRGRRPRAPGLRIHRVALPPTDVTEHRRIPVTTPARTLIDLATRLPLPRLERTVNQADKLGLIDPESLRKELERRPGQHGVPALRQLLDRDTFVLTDSELERGFVPIAMRAGLGRPETGVRVNGFQVDFYWRDLGLVVETDGLRYHRTPMQQARDRHRDQAHAAAGLTSLRFTHRQVTREASTVERNLAAVAARLRKRNA